jgi:diguanylate cyclase (GGDEF)-like protein
VDLDPRTLQFAAIVVCCVLGPVSLAFAPTQRHLRPSRSWGAGLIALAGGLALGSLRGHAPDMVSHILGFGLLALALTFAQSSARSLTGKDGRDVLGLTLLGLFVLMLLVQLRLSADSLLRDPLSMGALGVLALRVAVGFDQGGAPHEVRALRSIAVIFSIFGLSLIVQGGLMISHPPAGSGPGEAVVPMLVGLVAGLLLGSIVITWIMTERISHRLRQLISLDSLTNALNRHAFIQQFERQVARTRRRSDSQFAILIIDIDGFHRVNDASGHTAGDRLLKETVAVLSGTKRAYDVIGRLESDVFAMLMPGVLGEGAIAMADRARREVELQASVRAGLKNRVSVSIGIAVFGDHGESWDTLLRGADGAAKYAKTLGGNRARLAAPLHPSPGTVSGNAPA